MKNKGLKVAIIILAIIILLTSINIVNRIKINNKEEPMLQLDYSTNDSDLRYSIEETQKSGEHVTACLILENQEKPITEVENPKGNISKFTDKNKVALDYKFKVGENESFKIKCDEEETIEVKMDIGDFVCEGDGTTSNPYEIKNAIQLQRINKQLNGHYKIVADIDATGMKWTSIGTEETPFSGSIDGGGYTISNVTLESENDNIGLFGKVTGTIKNIKAENFNIKGNNNVGSIVGYATNIISDCEVKQSKVIATGDNIGGIVGYTISDVTNTISDVEVNGTNQVGGLIGNVSAVNKTITISGNKAIGKITGTGENIGGLIGKAQSHGNWRDSEFKYRKMLFNREYK